MAHKWDIPVLGTGGRKKVPFRTWGPLAAIGLVIGLYVLWTETIIRYIRVPNLDVVVEATPEHPGRILRSSCPKPRLSRGLLADNGVDVIVNLQGRDPCCPEQMTQERNAKELGVLELRFPMRGNGTPGVTDPNVAIDRYVGAIEAIATHYRAGETVLVQCSAGTHRTGGVVACYRMLVQNWRGRDAWEEMQKYGWKPRKHQVLADYINLNMHEIARRLIERGVVEKVRRPLPILGPKPWPKYRYGEPEDDD